MSSTMKITSYNNSYIPKTSTKKIELSAELKDYIENSSSEGKKLLKSLKNLFKDGTALSSLVASDTSNESVSVYKSGNTNVKNAISAFNNLLKYSKDNDDNPKLNKLYKSLKGYAKKETDTLKNFGITVNATGSLKISNTTTLKNSIADGSFGKYILEQSKSNNSFLGKLQYISKKFSYDNLSYISDNNIKIINAYNTNTLNNFNSATNNKTDSSNNISYYA